MNSCTRRKNCIRIFLKPLHCCLIKLRQKNIVVRKKREKGSVNMCHPIIKIPERTYILGMAMIFYARIRLR